MTNDLGIFSAVADIGTTGGSSSHASGTYTVNGNGATISVADTTTTDEFHYLYTSLTGDATLTAQVLSAGNLDCGTNRGWAGVMMRNTLAANSMYAMADQREPANNNADQRYRATAGASTVINASSATVPEWVRITRTGNSFTMFRSANGTAWAALGSPQTIAMASTIYVGLGSTSNNDGCIAAATFDNVSLVFPVAPVLAASGGTTAHTENVPVAVDTGITLTDTDSTNMASGTVTVGAGYTAGQDVLAFTNQLGITGSWSAPTMTLSGSATKANWQTALRSVTYNNTSHTPNAGNRTINFVVNDGGTSSNTAAKTVSVAAVNDAPVNSVPAGQSTATNTPEVFSSGNGNLMSITDLDAASADMRVQLVSSNGATTLSTLTGLSFTVGDGTADTTMTFDGTVAEVNAALNGVSFNPTTSFSGAASLQIVTSDQGNTGSGGTLTDTDTVAITVASSTSYYDAVSSTPGLMNYYRLNEATTTSDTFGTGSPGAQISTRTGEIGASWTAYGTNDTTTVLTAAGRIRKAGTSTWTSRYYASGVPTSPHYTVEANVYVASVVAGDAIAILGRVDTSSAEGTYYFARYEQTAAKWFLYRVSNGSWQWLGESSQTLVAGTTYKLMLDMSGSNIRLLVNDAPVVSVVDASPIVAAGRGGVSMGYGATSTTITDSTGMHLDNVRVVPRMADSEGATTGIYHAGTTLGALGALGEANSAVVFDGVDDHVSVNRTVSDDFSIEFWFKSTQGLGAAGHWAQYAGLVDANVSGGNNDFGVSLSADGHVMAGVGNGLGEIDTTISSLAGGYDDGNWHHVVFTRTRSTAGFALYVDGGAAVTGTGINTSALTASSVINFGRIATGVNYYAGSMDDVAIYTSVLSGATVTAHYNAR